jgi:hypothetical protein
VFNQLHQLLLAELNAAARIDWSRAAMDGSHIDAKKGVTSARRSTYSTPYHQSPGARADRGAGSRCCWPTKATKAGRSVRPADRADPARRGGKNIKGLGKLRYVVEQTFAYCTSSAASRSAGNAASTSMTAS